MSKDFDKSLCSESHGRGKRLEDSSRFKYFKKINWLRQTESS